MPAFAYRTVRIALLLAVAILLNCGALRAGEGESVSIDPAAGKTEQLPAPPLLELPAATPMRSADDWLLRGSTRPAPGGPLLTLDEALRRALANHPELAALKYEVYAAQGRELQGSIKPNPEFEAEISEFMGTAETRFFREAVTGFGVSQLIERGRKRCARMAVAQKEGQLAEYELERAQLDIMLEVSEAYYAALAAQQRATLALEREELAQQVYDTVGLRVEGGKAARLEQTRVGIDVSAARLARQEAQRELRVALTVLASLWAGDPDEFAGVEGVLELPAEVPQLDPLLDAVQASPELRRWAAEEELRRAERDLAQAEGVPDITWSGGLERFEGTDSFGFKVGVSFPIQLRRSTQGKVVEAQAYIDQVEALRAAAERELGKSLAALHARMQSAHARALEIERDLLPSAIETFDLTQVGYRYGKFGLLEVLDAQRTLIDIRDQYFDALAQYHAAAVQVERLIAQQPGEPFPTAPQPASAATASLAGTTNTQEHNHD